MNNQTFIGKVRRKSLGNAVIVTVSRVRKHPRYQKILHRSKNFLVENLVNAKVGDLVKIVKSRPLSKLKHFIVKEVVKK